uniref:Synemin n=1 Tax=Crocodylus porosus TaxID=8502 RepID=A0A7M4G2R6_CROPO
VSFKKESTHTEAQPGIEQKKYVIEEGVVNKRFILGDLPEWNKKVKDVTLESRRKETIEIPISFEMHSPDKTLKTSDVEITLEGLKTAAGREKDEHRTKHVDTRNENIPEREINLGDTEGVRDKSSPKISSSLTENIAENIVADILKSFVPSSGSETSADTEVTYHEKKERFDDGKVKTEITVQSTVQDEVDLGDVLNKDAKKGVLEDIEGTPSKEEIEDIIDVGLKGREGMGKMSVNVEIIEEPLDSPVDERSEFSTPFEVEEVEDTSPGLEGRYGDEEEHNLTMTDENLKKKTEPCERFTNVEEVTEAEETTDEQKYFVSVPDDHPSAQENDDDSVYGQIHIEEESAIKYSWQDEFLQGMQSKKDDGMRSPEVMYQVVGEEASAHILKEEPPRDDASHVESTVIERDIKIPHEFQTSIKELLSKETKDPKHQLKEALEQLEGSLPESVKKELSALMKENQADSSNLAVDIKKVEKTDEGGSVTFVAEVSLSQTVDPAQYDIQFDIPQFDDVIMSEMEKTSPWSPKKEGPAPFTSQEVYSFSSVRIGDGDEYRAPEQALHQGPVSETLEFDSAGGDSPSHFDRSIRHFKLGPIETHSEQIIFKGPISEALEDLSQTEGSSERPKETSFTFQMDVTNVGAPDVSRSRVIVGSDQKDAENGSSRAFFDSSQDHSEQLTEKSVFNKTAELQRMVDQRSVVSDEKKIALLYLDKEEEEEEEDNDGQWF